MVVLRDPTTSLVDSIYDAALSPEHWGGVLTKIADATGSAGGIIFWMAPHRREVFGRSIGRLDAYCSDVYEQRHFSNPWADHMLQRQPGTLVRSDEILPLTRLEQTEFYFDVLRPQNIGHNGMSALIARPDLVVAFNITQTNSQGPLDQQSFAFLQELLPHLQRASQLHLRVQQYETLRAGTLGALDLLEMGVIVIDRWASVLYANRSALLCEKAGRLSLAGRMITLPMPSINGRLKALIKSALTSGSGGSLALSNRAGDTPVTALISPLRGRIVAEIGGGHLSGAAAVIFLRDSTLSPGPDQAQIATSFGFTPAEARAAMILLKGDDLATAASELGISTNTLKTHARRIFAKVGVRRHSQFVYEMTQRLLATIP